MINVTKGVFVTLYIRKYVLNMQGNKTPGALLIERCSPGTLKIRVSKLTFDFTQV